MGWKTYGRTSDADALRAVSIAVLIIGLIVIGLLLRLIIREQRGLLGILLAGVTVAMLVYWLREARRTVREELKPIAAPQESWVYEIHEEEEAVTLIAQVPGPEEQVKVKLLDDGLEIRGGGNFYKRLSLPSRVESHTVAYRHGVLEVRMKKKR
ncbi:MAG: Hsp20/alpha crystallin family protein [Candidatus Geothermarchaeales archaeon]